MIIIGLCGSSGAGKGYVCEKFSHHGVAFIDTDRVYREEVLTDQRCIGELTDYFGNGILVGGSVSKKRLAELVFEGDNSQERLARLNQITHKYIKIKTEELIRLYEGQGYSATLVDAPVLFESGFDKMCHVTICVTAPYEQKLQRIMDRDKISREKAQARLCTQLGDEKLRQACTYEIDNTDGKDIECQINSILKELSIEES